MTDPALTVPPVLVTEQHRPSVAHYVTDAEVRVMADGADPRALCGTVFRPAGLTAPLGTPCAGCVAARGPVVRPDHAHRWYRRAVGPASWPCAPRSLPDRAAENRGGRRRRSS